MAQAVADHVSGTTTPQVVPAVQHVDEHAMDFSLSVGQVISTGISTQQLTTPWLPTPAKSGKGSCFAIQCANEVVFVTNHHVIANARKVQITLPHFGTGKKFDCRVLVDCPTKDIAILRVLDTDVKFVPMKLADSDAIQQATPVMTLGYPLGCKQMKITSGVCAGRERTPSGATYLQIDAALCPGNSGGPLCQKNNGYVVGINSAIIPGQNCVGYSIPVSQLQSVIHDYKYELATKSFDNKTCYLRPPVLGVVWQNNTKALNACVKNPVADSGLYVSYVLPNSIMAQAGLCPGSVVTAISVEDDVHRGKLEPVNMSGEMKAPYAGDGWVHISNTLGRLREGDKVHCEVWHDNQAKSVDFTYTPAEDPRRVKQIFFPYDKINWDVAAGMCVADLTMNHVGCFVQQNPTLARYMDPSQTFEPALIISHVSPYSVAAETGVVCPGMLLVAINGQQVRSVSDMTQILQSRDLDSVQFTVKGFCPGVVATTRTEMLEQNKAVRCKQPAWPEPKWVAAPPSVDVAAAPAPATEMTQERAHRLDAMFMSDQREYGERAAPAADDEYERICGQCGAIDCECEACDSDSDGDGDGTARSPAQPILASDTVVDLQDQLQQLGLGNLGLTETEGHEAVAAALVGTDAS